MTQDKTIREVTGEAIGEASLCWEPRPTGVFESTQAKEITERAEQAIKEIMAKDKAELVEACKMAKIQLINCSYAFDMPNRFRESFNQGQKQLKQAISNAEKGEG